MYSVSLNLAFYDDFNQTLQRDFNSLLLVIKQIHTSILLSNSS